MKNLISTSGMTTLAGMLCSFSLSLGGAEVNATVSAQVPVPSAQVAVSTGLPPAANEVVKLTRAQVSEDVIISYVQNSRASSSLTSDDIVRLRNEGVSDRVINALLDRHSKVMETLPKTVAPAPVYADDSNLSAPAQAQPAPTVEAPLAPTSSSYVIPYPAATAAYYGYYRPYYPYYSYPYYGGYYGSYYGGPIVSFRFGFGGRGGSWHGHGGSWGGGGSWHGGSHHGHR
jgi:hypothetical protein